MLVQHRRQGWGAGGKPPLYLPRDQASLVALGCSFPGRSSLWDAGGVRRLAPGEPTAHSPQRPACGAPDSGARPCFWKLFLEGLASTKVE